MKLTQALSRYSITFFLATPLFLVSAKGQAKVTAEMAEMLPAKIMDAEGSMFSRDVLSGKIVGFYFSANWCPPCRTFSPKLVEFRNKNQKDFEIVYISFDENPTAQMNYMKKANMKWYTLPYGSIDGNKLAQEYGITGIPTLVIVSPNGKTITRNGRGDVTYNPNGALAAWKKSPAYEEVKKEEDDVVDKDPANPPVTKPAPDRKIPDQAPEAPPSLGNEKTIKELTAANEEQAKLIEELRKQTEQCSTELGQTKASNANLAKENESLRKAIASLRTERDDLKERFTNASSDAATCSRDLAVAKQELEAAKKVTNSPFVNGWVYDPDQGWLFTNAKIYPSIYSSSTKSWHHYELGSAKPRLFYNYKDETWEAWDSIPDEGKGALAVNQGDK
jgi:nucleoredoxin